MLNFQNGQKGAPNEVSVMSTFICSRRLSDELTADMRHVANCRLSAKCKQQKTAPRRHAQCVRLTYYDLLLLILRVQRL